MSKPGYYAVRKGKKRGLFHSWVDCEAQVKGFPNAEFKKFKTHHEAQQYLGDVNTTVTRANCQSNVGPPPLPTAASSRVELSSRPHPLAAPRSKSRSSSKGGDVYYAVRRGFSTGIFRNWAACEIQIRGFAGASFSKFQDLSAAEAFLVEPPIPASSLKRVTTAMSTSTVSSRAEKVEDEEGSEGSVPLSPPSRDPVVLSVQQFRGLQRILAGGHVFLSGSAGTGKSFLVQLLREVRSHRRAQRTRAGTETADTTADKTADTTVSDTAAAAAATDTSLADTSSSADTAAEARVAEGLLAITASTGCAAVGIGGQTLHAWAGVGTGLGSDLTAEELFMKLGKHNRNNWLRTSLLLIDEISMISAKELDKLSELAGLVRQNPHLPFGGMQVVLSGDFLQLPPVSKPQAPASFCFESKVWKQLFPIDSCHESVVILTKIQRQKEPIFQRILNSLRFGVVTPEVDWFLRRKSVGNLLAARAAATTTAAAATAVADVSSSSSSEWFTNKGGHNHRSSVTRSVKLFSRLADVARVNNTCLSALPATDTITITAQDSVSSSPHSTEPPFSLLSRLNQELPAPKTLDLKVGAQVMLIANLDTNVGLVNGARGRVVRFESSRDEETGVDVLLPVVRFSIESSSLKGAEEERRRLREGLTRRLPESNRGYKLFSGMGYQAWEGLGRGKSGSPEPVSIALASQCSLGLSSGSTVSATVERTIEAYSFHLKNSVERVLATRRQVPLILAYAITIHKTQGMSIPHVEVNMEGIFTSGQAYVALSRATSAEGLAVTGYNRSLVYSCVTAVGFYRDVERRIREQAEGEVSRSSSKETEGGAGVVMTSVHDLCNIVIKQK